MLKKTLYVGAGVALLLGLLFGRDAISYVATGIASVRQSVKDSIPIEVELERAENMITNITPEIRRSRHIIAKEEVEIDRLEKRINGLEDALAQDESNIMRLKADLEGGDSYFVYAGHRYDRGQVNADLENRFERFKTKDATLGNLKKVLAARQKSVAAAREKLGDMVASKRQLEVEIENMRARTKMLEVAKTTSDFKFDDSHLARTQSLLSDIDARIQAEELVVNEATSVNFDEIPLDEPTETKNVTDAITDYFSAPRPNGELVDADL